MAAVQISKVSISLRIDLGTTIYITKILVRILLRDLGRKIAVRNWQDVAMAVKNLFRASIQALSDTSG